MTSTPISEPEARALADAISQVSDTQPAAEALRLVEMALTRAPDSASVLNAAAGHMHRSGEPVRARELFARALSIDSKSKVLWLNMAAVYRTLGEVHNEQEALDKALGIEPRYVLALLQKGELMERLGRSKPAAIAYEAALASLASGAPAPKQAAAMLARAQEVVLTNSRAIEAYLEQELAGVRARHRDENQERFQGCQDAFLSKRFVYASRPKQIHFPYLPAIEFFGRDQFPWLDTLERATEEIAAEAMAALQRDRAEFAPYVDAPDFTPLDQWAPLNHSLDWSVYSLWNDGVRVEPHLGQCPRTAAVLEQLPLCDIADWAPGAYFSVLKPRTRLPAHTGTTNTRSIVHLPLVVPEGCRFRVGSQMRAWEKGKAWVFDDSIDHEAWNDSDQIRIILIFDIWNPLLTAAERELVRAMTMAIGRYYGADSPQLASQ